MGGEPEYDTRRLRALQKDLGTLNAAHLPRVSRGDRGAAKTRRAAVASQPDEAASREDAGEPANPAKAVADERPSTSKSKPKRKGPSATKRAHSLTETAAVAKPAAKVAKPAAKVAKPAAKVAKPAAKVAKPAAKVAKPAAKADKRGKASAKSAADPAKPAVAPEDKGKAGARRLLRLLRRTDGDDSPPVPGTDFTEGGVVRLLAHLRRRKSQSFRFLRRLLRVLTRPAALGMRTSAGVSVERLQLVARQLEEIEIHGWDHFQSRRLARRGRQGLPFAAGVGMPDAPAVEG